jgi:hypothetical protein
MGKILHVGFPKTATTYLQSEVFPKIKNIKFLPLDATDKKAIDALLKIRNISRPIDPEAIKKILYPYDLLSLESLSGDIYSSNIEDRSIIAQRLKIIFPHSKIIIGIRDKNSIIRSAYSQYIKEGGIYRYDDYIAKVVHQERFKFENYIKIMKDLFNSKNVFIYKFEDLKENPEETVKKMTQFIGKSIDEFKVQSYNVSWNSKQIKTCRRLNRFFRTRLNPYGIIPYPDILTRKSAYLFPPRLLVNRLI